MFVVSLNHNIYSPKTWDFVYNTIQPSNSDNIDIESKVDPDEIKAQRLCLEQIFDQYFDSDGKGLKGECDFDEWQMGLRKLDVQLNDAQQRELFKLMDDTNGGIVDKEQFVQIMMDQGRAFCIGDEVTCDHLMEGTVSRITSNEICVKIVDGDGMISFIWIDRERQKTMEHAQLAPLRKPILDLVHQHQIHIVPFMKLMISYGLRGRRINQLESECNEEKERHIQLALDIFDSKETEERLRQELDEQKQLLIEHKCSLKEITEENETLRRSGSKQSVSALRRIDLESLHEFETNMISSLQNVQMVIKEKNDRERECTICRDRPKDTALIPCGHCLCSNCESRMTKCPMCRVNIQRTLKLL